ncbi:hypothetical protein CC2G_007971 [Coprinopsis cinerea AmutBmut pab1-1]|nr:hypothetical protein CC2G_007971 [Coprinopsis cinerea AmutBmut pab1-1]
MSEKSTPMGNPECPSGANHTNGHLCFFDKSPEGITARRTYLKVFICGTLFVAVMIFTILPIYWGALYKVPVRNLEGWVVDFDGDMLGQTISQALVQIAAQRGRITWIPKPASDFSRGLENLAQDVRDERIWAAIAISPSSTTTLFSSIQIPNPAYNGSNVITAYAVEARNEQAYRGLIRPSIDLALTTISHQLALETTKRASRMLSPTALQVLSQESPQTLVAPVGYTIHNLIPFDQPVASAATFVGMLLQLALSAFVVMVAFGARTLSGYEHSLSTTRLLILRFVSIFAGFFFISLMYCLLNLAFQLDVTRKYGHAGFVVFWMVNFLGTLATGLAIESILILFGPKGVPFFLLLWIIVNLSATLFPIEVLPAFYRYGYGVPFYSLTKALRTIVFGTKDRMGRTCGILIAWISISCITIPVFQCYKRAINTSVLSSNR